MVSRLPIRRADELQLPLTTYNPHWNVKGAIPITDRLNQTVYLPIHNTTASVAANHHTTVTPFTHYQAALANEQTLLFTAPSNNTWQLAVWKASTFSTQCIQPMLNGNRRLQFRLSGTYMVLAHSPSTRAITVVGSVAGKSNWYLKLEHFSSAHVSRGTYVWQYTEQFPANAPDHLQMPLSVLAGDYVTVHILMPTSMTGGATWTTYDGEIDKYQLEVIPLVL